jgi:hypothetical protein
VLRVPLHLVARALNILASPVPGIAAAQEQPAGKQGQQSNEGNDFSSVHGLFLSKEQVVNEKRLSDSPTIT